LGFDMSNFALILPFARGIALALSLAQDRPDAVEGV
jgi:hypothetical protein